MAIGYPKDWVADRTTLAENPKMSKAVRRYGVDGAKGNFTHGSTGGHVAHEDEVAPSAPSHNNTERAVMQAKNAGFDPHSGKWLGVTHPNTGKHDGGHEPARVATTDGASGQAHSASGGKFGKPTQRPARASNTGTRTADAGALAGTPKTRTSYQGGKGPVR